MIFVMAVTLYTSRVVLNTLGVVDYGIYNVAGGVISMFAFLNTAMSSASQRYITYTLGQGKKDRLSLVFSTSVQIHALIGLFVIILGETVGLWFLLNKLVIPAERMTAAIWVFQCSIAIAVISIMSVPYNADIIANEKMSAFAYISVLEAILKLLIVYLIIISPFDKLIFYALLGVAVQFFIRSIYVHYCTRHFEESKFHLVIDKPLLKEMLSFAGWSFFGNFAYVLYTQGVNMMLNMFFGPIVNAARGIAVQVQGAIHGFAGNFQMAINPQITKNYAVGNLHQMHSLMFKSARFSYYLLFLLILPLFLETKYLLTLWLKIVPENTVIFLQLMLAIALLNPFASPCTIANQATGVIKRFQFIVGTLLMMILPISYVVLRLGAPAYAVFIVHFCIEAIAVLVRMVLLKDLIHLPVIDYFKNVFSRVIVTTIFSVIMPIMVRSHMDEGFLRFTIVTATSLVSVGGFVFVFGLTQTERVFIRDKVKQKLHFS